VEAGVASKQLRVVETYDLFLDLDPERGLKAGERWQAALKQAAERCELVIFLVSPEWAASKWCLAEFLLAKNFNKRIFGVIIEPTPFADIPAEMTAESGGLPQRRADGNGSQTARADSRWCGSHCQFRGCIYLGEPRLPAGVVAPDQRSTPVHAEPGFALRAYCGKGAGAQTREPSLQGVR